MADDLASTVGIEEDYPPYDYPSFFTLGDPEVFRPITTKALCFAGAFGALANTFVIIASMMSKKFRQKLSVFFLIMQSVADLFCSFAVMIVYAVLLYTPKTLRGTSGDAFCKIFWSESMIYCGLTTSALNMVAVTVERYLMIVFPVYHRSSFTKLKAIVIVTFTWIIGFCLSFPSLVNSKPLNGRCNLNFYFNSQNAHQVFSILIIFIVFILPVSFKVYAYIHMIVVLRKRNKVQPSSQQKGEQKSKMSKAQMNLFMTAVIITVIYVVTYMPYHLYNMLWGFGTPLSYGDILYPLSILLAQLHACINPFIYICKFKEFQDNARKIFCRKRTAKTVSTSGHDEDTIVTK